MECLMCNGTGKEPRRIGGGPLPPVVEGPCFTCEGTGKEPNVQVWQDELTPKAETPDEVERVYRDAEEGP